MTVVSIMGKKKQLLEDGNRHTKTVKLEIVEKSFFISEITDDSSYTYNLTLFISHSGNERP
jgi:hypothetical protein